MKAYILAGKIEQDHLWLTKKEIEERNPELYAKLGDILD